MKKKFIVASTIGLLGVTSMVIGAVTLADNDFTGQKAGMRIHVGSGMMNKGGTLGLNRGKMMGNFTNTGDAEAFRTAKEKAITNGDYTAFTQAHIKYNITTPLTKDQFTTMVERRATQEKSLAALKNGDYTTWKTLNTGNQILTKIDTEAKFKTFQEMQTYREKISTIRTKLGLGNAQGKGMGMINGMHNGNGGMNQ